jgi:hypothetical protein
VGDAGVRVADAVKESDRVRVTVCEGELDEVPDNDGLIEGSPDGVTDSDGDGPPVDDADAVTVPEADRVRVREGVAVAVRDVATRLADVLSVRDPIPLSVCRAICEWVGVSALDDDALLLGGTALVDGLGVALSHPAVQRQTLSACDGQLHPSRTPAAPYTTVARSGTSRHVHIPKAASARGIDAASTK